MSQPGTLAAALAFVPNWWQETADPFALDSRLTEWSHACGWRLRVGSPERRGNRPRQDRAWWFDHRRAAGGSPRCLAANSVR